MKKSFFRSIAVLDTPDSRRARAADALDSILKAKLGSALISPNGKIETISYSNSRAQTKHAWFGFWGKQHYGRTDAVYFVYDFLTPSDHFRICFPTTTALDCSEILNKLTVNLGLSVDIRIDKILEKIKNCLREAGVDEEDVKSLHVTCNSLVSNFADSGQIWVGPSLPFVGSILTDSAAFTIFGMSQSVMNRVNKRIGEAAFNKMMTEALQLTLCREERTSHEYTIPITQEKINLGIVKIDRYLIPPAVYAEEAKPACLRLG